MFKKKYIVMFIIGFILTAIASYAYIQFESWTRVQALAGFYPVPDSRYLRYIFHPGYLTGYYSYHYIFKGMFRLVWAIRFSAAVGVFAMGIVGGILAMIMRRIFSK